MNKDDEIIQAFKADKQQGFRLLMEIYQRPLYYQIRRMVVVHADTEDILQEVFIRIYAKLHTFRREASLRTWVYRITANECLRFIHKRRSDLAEAEEGNAELMNRLMTTDYMDYENEMAIRFQQALLRLPEKQRMVFNLRYYDELEYSEISEIMKLKEETLRVDYHYAKEKIKNYILKS